MSYFNEYRILLNGEAMIASASIHEDGSVEVAWISDLDGRDIKTHSARNPKNAADVTVAFSAWSPEQRASLYQAIRDAAR